MLENLIIDSISPVITLMPDIDFSGIFSHPGVETFIDILCAVSYFFPWNTVLTIVGIIAGFQTLRLIIAFLKALWGILPVA